MSEPLRAATVIASFGRIVLVRADGDEALLQAQLRGRRMTAVCGDRVGLQPGDARPAVIEAVEPRRNAFVRAARHRSKVLAANLTQVVVLVACEPSFSEELVCRFLVAAEHAGLPALIALNKVDLAARRDAALGALAPFRGLGYPVIELAARLDPGPLLPFLQRQRSALVGQSGMGKSTLVNALVPGAQVRIGEISRYLDAGRQTTSTARLYTLDAASELVDTPGVSEFGLGALDPAQIAAGFREFAPHAGGCRFQDCRHLAEPDCALSAAAEGGGIHPRRLAMYRRILQREGHA